MDVSYTEPLAAGWERMKRILFRPFDPARWFVLGFAAWLAGLGSDDLLKLDPSKAPDLGDAASWLSLSVNNATEDLFWLPFAGFGLMFSVAVVALLLWLSSRGKFVFLDDVIHDKHEIVAPWKRYAKLGDSLFLWRICFVLSVFGIFLLIGALVLGPAVALRGSEAAGPVAVVTVILAVLALVVVALATSVVTLLLDSFVVPIMYAFDVSAVAAWRILLPWLTNYPGQFTLYVLLLLVLGLGVAVGLTLVGVLTCCLGFALLWLPYLGTVFVLPIPVVVRVFSLEFLAQFDPRFDLMDRAAAEAIEVAQAPGS